jgi:hypothetical protein
MGFVVVSNAALNPPQLQGQDLADDIVRQREIGHQGEAAEEGRLEDLEQFGAQRLGQAGRIRPRLGIGALTGDQIRSGIRRHDDDGALEIDVAALAVAQHALVEHLA